MYQFACWTVFLWAFVLETTLYTSFLAAYSNGVSVLEMRFMTIFTLDTLLS